MVALGAAVGAPLRYLIDRGIQARYKAVFPWGTLIANLSACLALGLVTGTATAASPAQVHALIGTGLAGALSTLSTFSYQTLRLVEEGFRFFAIAYVLVSVAVGLAAATGGLTIAHMAWALPRCAPGSLCGPGLSGRPPCLLAARRRRRPPTLAQLPGVPPQSNPGHGLRGGQRLPPLGQPNSGHARSGQTARSADPPPSRHSRPGTGHPGFRPRATAASSGRVGAGPRRRPAEADAIVDFGGRTWY